MKLEIFFEKFDLLADAPDAVAKMRELILQLAVQGKLVEQRPNELSAGECINKANKALIDVTPDESVETPKGWVSLPLGCLIATNTGGGTPSKQNPSYWKGAIPWASVKDVRSDKYLVSTIDSISEEGLKDSSSNLIPPNRLIVVTRMGLGKLAINTIPVAINQDLRAIEPTTALDLDFAYLLFKALKMVGSGVTVKGITVDKLHAMPVLIPPLAEQKRIVAKVDELMTLCDRLGTQQQEREARHDELARASLARFAEAATPANLNFLFHKSYSIAPADFRKSILTLAVQGKLVPQDPNDEPVSKLLERLVSLIGESGKAYKPLLPIVPDAFPFELPLSWEWVQAQDLCRPFSLITYGVLKPVWVDVGVPTVRVQDMQGGTIVVDGVGQCSPERAAKFAKTTLEEGDLLIAKDGATLGKTAFVPPPLAGGNITQHVMRFPITPHVDRMFIRLVIDSPHGQGWMQRETKGVALPGINVGDFRRLPIPLPPLSEQRRIVAKVDELKTLVHALQSQLDIARRTHGEMLESAIMELTGEVASRSLRWKISQPKPVMKKSLDSQNKHRPKVKPLNLATNCFVLRRFSMRSAYRSLGAFDCTFHTEDTGTAEAAPICLVGLNGSGKSNLIEAIAEIFCFLELINLPWAKVESPSSRYRTNRHHFELEYTLKNSTGEYLVRIRKAKKTGAEFYIVSDNGDEQPVKAWRDQLLLLPRRIIGYSSGLNETVSHPFLRTRTIYSEEVRDAAPPQGVNPSADEAVFDTRTLYMDYESNAAILICNYLFNSPSQLKLFDEFTRVRGVSSFRLRFNRKIAGKSGPNSIVRLTYELHDYLGKFARCAGRQYDREQHSYDFQFKIASQTRAAFRKEFKTSENLFMAMYKWSLLNALVLSDEQRNVYLRSDITHGTLERPPSVPPSDRIFDIVDLKLNLSTPRMEIDYSGLSDGEHQFVQVFGTTLLFSKPGSLFIFDEPESHFNPEWRTRFNLTLNGQPNANQQEYVISTHSPFVVSGSRKGNVYKFTRKDAQVEFHSVEFETYGASFDLLLKKLFSVDSLIDQSARNQLEKIIQRGDETEMKAAVEDFAESKEKRKLYEAILQKEEKS